MLAGTWVHQRALSNRALGTQFCTALTTFHIWGKCAGHLTAFKCDNFYYYFSQISTSSKMVQRSTLWNAVHKEQFLSLQQPKRPSRHCSRVVQCQATSNASEQHSIWREYDHLLQVLDVCRYNGEQAAADGKRRKWSSTLFFCCWYFGKEKKYYRGIPEIGTDGSSSWASDLGQQQPTGGETLFSLSARWCCLNKQKWPKELS